MDKKSYLLETIIDAYLQMNEPIGSNQLKVMYDIPFSSATIRGYFKKLGEIGYLIQEHSSSGRIPSKLALMEYWNNTLDLDIKNIDKELLKELVEQLKMSVFIRYEKDEYLKDIHLIKEKFIVLEFSTIAFTIKYNKALYRFLKELIEFSIRDILQIASEVGANEVKDEIIYAVNKNYFDILNYEEFIKNSIKNNIEQNIISYYENGLVLNDLKKGIYFDLLPQDQMGVVLETQIDNELSKLLIIGPINSNFKYLLERIKDGR